MPESIGIDLGTTNSVVAACDEGGEPRVLPDPRDDRIQPSVVSFHPNGAVIVGDLAKQRRVIDPRNTVYSIKRLIGRPFSAPEVQAAVGRVPFPISEGPNQQPVIHSRAGEFAITEISAFILDHLRAIAERALRSEITQAVITVPASFNEAQRTATATAGAIAGLDVVRVINEPTAAALAYGHRSKLDGIIAVYDFGGGTFDVTLLRVADQVYEVLSTAGDSFLGGDDIDETLVEHMVEVFLERHHIDLQTDDVAMQRLRSVAEQVKIQLSRRARAVVKISQLARGGGGEAIDLHLEVSRDELVRRCAHIIDQTFPVCDEALTLARIHRSQITDVVLVGGTTKIPYVRQRAAEHFGRQPRADINPDEAVALGAALQADVLVRRDLGLPPRPMTGTADTHTEVTRAESRVDRRVSDLMAAADRRRTASSVIVEVDSGSLDEATDVSGDVTLDEDAAGDTAGATLRRDTLPQFGDGSRRPPQPPRPPPPPPPPPEGPQMWRPPPPPEHVPDAPDTQTHTVPRAPRPGSGPPLDLGVDPSMFPVVREVTPHTLGIGTVAGYCEAIIGRNTQIPFRTTRIFSTSKNGQQTVRIQVFQGESRLLHQNMRLGDLVLDQLPPRPRGETQIEVTFAINASGMLEVSAIDSATGQERRAAVELVGLQSDDEVTASQVRMRDFFN